MARIPWALGLLACCGTALADPPPGKIDYTFGDGGPSGITEVGFNLGDSWYDFGSALAEDAQGRLVMAGVADHDDGPCLGLMRFSADGVLDKQAFGFNQDQVAKGKICYPNPLGAEFPLAFDNLSPVRLALQGDGRILVAGRAKQSPFVCRFKADGSRDETFGAVQTPGCTRMAEVSTSSWPAPQVLVRGDALLLISDHDAAGHQVVVRMALEDGSPMPYGDKAFVPALSADVVDGFIWDAVLAPDGGIIAAGYHRNGEHIDMLIARFDADTGTPDPGFAGKGWRSIAFDKVPGGSDSASAVHVTPDGTALVVGEVENASYYQLGVIQFDAVTGEPDPAFNAGQPLDYDPCQDVPGGCFLQINTVSYTQSGNIVIEGESDGRMFAARLRPDLAPDAMFGDSHGMAVTPAGTTFGSGASAGAVLQGERIVLGGWHGDPFTDVNFALLRLSGGDLFGDDFETTP